MDQRITWNSTYKYFKFYHLPSLCIPEILLFSVHYKKIKKKKTLGNIKYALTI